MESKTAYMTVENLESYLDGLERGSRGANVRAEETSLSVLFVIARLLIMLVRK